MLVFFYNSRIYDPTNNVGSSENRKLNKFIIFIINKLIQCLNEINIIIFSGDETNDKEREGLKSKILLEAVNP